MEAPYDPVKIFSSSSADDLIETLNCKTNKNTQNSRTANCVPSNFEIIQLILIVGVHIGVIQFWNSSFN